MAYNAQVTITVKVDGQKVAKRKVKAEVGNVEGGKALVDQAKAAIDGLARELGERAGVTV